MAHPRLFLIDAHTLCYRSFYAIKGLVTSKGQATNAVYGFINTLKKIMRDFDPEYVAVCFDTPAKTHRQEKYAAYKIQRPKMPDDLISQIPIIKKVVRSYNLPMVEKEGYEADDMIAAIVKKMAKKDMEIIIATEDKDMYQLLGDQVKMYSARRDKVLGEKDVEEFLGIDPKYITDYIGLAGDSTDNIPGVKGIGEVSAKKLINEFGRLEDIYKNLDKVAPDKLREKLADQKKEAFFSKELAILATDAPVDATLKDMKVGQADEQALFEIFSELEFRKLASELSGQAQKHKAAKVEVLKTKADIKAFADGIKNAGEMVLYIPPQEEQQDLLRGDQIFLCAKADQVACTDLKNIESLVPVLENEKITKVVHDLKGTYKILNQAGCGLKGNVFDILLAGYLLAPATKDLSIPSLCWEHLKMSSKEKDDAQDAAMIRRLYTVLNKELKQKDLSDLLTDIEVPLSLVLARMENEGISVDVDILNKLSVQCGKKIKVLMDQLFEMAGEEFNLNSPKQLSRILFEKLKLPVIKKTKTGFSTDEGVLARLADQHDLPALILEYRQLAKLKSTYFDAIPKLVVPKTGKVHGVFNQVGTETGRLSSNNPNLQNIPIRTELGRQIRKAFVPSKKNYVIVAVDYSQIELRILAHLSNDKDLIQAFEDGEDIHTYTAAQIFDVPEGEVTSEMRYSAKRVNFGIVYGMSAFGLAKDLKVPQHEAQAFIDKYFARYPGVKAFMDEQIKLCEERGYVVTLLKRRRYLPEIKSSNQGLKQFAQRQAINTPVQGSAADLIKLAMIRVQNILDEEGFKAKMVLTVHDELVFDVPEKETARLLPMVRDEMENAIKLKVPVEVTIRQGENWLDAKRVDL